MLKRGGRFYCLEFSTSEWPGFGELYDRYSEHLIPRIGKAVAKDEESYRYLVESIRRFPKMDAFRANDRRGRVQVDQRRADPRRPRRNPRRLEDLTTAVTHLWRLLKWGRTLARHGALQGIERDPLTPPNVRRLCRVARFGTRNSGDPGLCRGAAGDRPGRDQARPGAATRPDLVGAGRRAKTCCSFRIRLPPEPFPAIKTAIEKALEAPLESLFREFDEEPVGAASIAQVHHADHDRRPGGRGQGPPPRNRGRIRQGDRDL